MANAQHLGGLLYGRPKERRYQDGLGSSILLQSSGGSHRFFGSLYDGWLVI